MKNQASVAQVTLAAGFDQADGKLTEDFVQHLSPVS